MLGNRIEYDRMAEVEEKHWWYCSLHERVLRTLQKSFTDKKDIEILDAGCGTGGLLLYLQKNGYKNLRGFDISEFALEHCKRRNLNVFEGSVGEIPLYFQPETRDVVVCCDVLYFLNFGEQKKTLVDFYKLLKPGGIMILNLPAMKIFKGIHDLSVGIKERYHHKDLNGILPQAVVNKGYTFRYWPVLATPAMLPARAFQRMKIKSQNFITESDIHLPPEPLNDLMKGLMKLEMKFLPSLNFGSSLFVVAQK